MKYKLRAISVCLWILAGIALVYVYYFKGDNSPKDEGDGGSAEIEFKVLRDTPWKHFPTVPHFELKDQTGETFDSSELAGKPYAVNIFFSNCKQSCWKLNKQVKRLGERFENDDVMFVSITCDPKNDTPEVLNKYAQQLDADPDRWKFLTGQMYRIQELSSQAFFVNLEPQTHSQKILVVDKWGRYRDFFEWDDPNEMQRFSVVMKDLIAERTPPLNESFLSRNKTAASNVTKGSESVWVREFGLTDANGDEFYSRDMTGKVWLINFFFSKCPTICPKFNAYAQTLLARMPDEIELASISVDPMNDTPATLRQYIKTRNFEDDRWHFLTADSQDYVRRIGYEFCNEGWEKAPEHSAMICAVDRWGNLRGKYNWNFRDAEADFISFCRKLSMETVPPAKFEVIQFGKSDPEGAEIDAAIGEDR